MKEVLILGTGLSMFDILGKPKKCETWGLNKAYKYYNECDKLFLFHDYKLWYSLEELKNVKVVSNYEIDTDHEIYPLEEIKNALGSNYFGSTPCYMVAYAIYKKYERIHLYGIDMVEKERELERPGIEFWLGYGRGQGIEIIKAPRSAVCPEVYYGYKE